MNDILDTQIKNQITNTFVIEMFFNDDKPECIKIQQNEKNYALKPLFLLPRIISESDFNEILNMCDNTNTQLRQTEAHCEMNYDDFFSKYYNYRELAEFLTI